MLLLFASATPVSAKGKRTYEMIYQEIKVISPCIRRMNATHQIGCSSNFGGNTGVIHLIENETDIEWLRDTGPHAPYIAFVTIEMFTRDTIEQLLATGKVNGFIVDHSNQTRTDFVEESPGYSSDRSCPNDGFGLYHGTEYEGCSKARWNRFGDGSNFDIDFGVPMFALTHELEVEFIRQCYEEHNHPNDSMPAVYPLCAMELQDFMDGVKDTPTCMWRTERVNNLELTSYCDPIGDQNVWGFAKNSNDTDSSSYKSVIVAASPLDSTSLFYNVFPRTGSESAITSFVPLLAAAEAIGRLPKEEKESWERDIMFIFFNAESYDYTGSSRMAFDMFRGYFPTSAETIDEDEKDTKRLPQMNITNIGYFLELRQLGLSNGTYYAHVDPISQKDAKTKTETDKMIESLQTAGGVDISRVGPDIPLPPASLQQFLKKGINIPGVVLTDHHKEYKNSFYNSRFDIPESLHVDNETDIDGLAVKLNKVSEMVAKALVSLAGGNDNLVSTNETLVNVLLDCFMLNISCTLFKSLNDKPDDTIRSVGVDLYPGVSFRDHRHDTEGGILARRLLSYFLGEKTEIKTSDKDEKCNEPDDNEIYSYRFAIGPKMNSEDGICIKSTVHTTEAVSPAFVDDKDTDRDWASTEYATWTESQWSQGAFAIKVFLVPSPQQEWVIFSLGLAITLVSFPLAYFVNARADVLFQAESSY